MESLSRVLKVADRKLICTVGSGEVLTITAFGNLTEEVVEGAYVILQVKWSVIYLVNQKEMLCDQVKRIDKECPLEPGPLNFTKEVEIPSQVPPVSSISKENGNC